MDEQQYERCFDEARKQCHWSEFVPLGDRCFKEEDFEHAQRSYKEAIEMADSYVGDDFPDDSELFGVKVLLNVVSVEVNESDGDKHYRNRRFKKARDCYYEALQNAEEANGLTQDSATVDAKKRRDIEQKIVKVEVFLGIESDIEEARKQVEVEINNVIKGKLRLAEELGRLGLDCP